MATAKQAAPRKAAPKAAKKAPAARKAAPKAAAKPAAAPAAPSKRDLYVEKLKAQLDAWNEDLKRLEAKAAKVSGDAREKVSKQLAELEKRAEGEKLLKQLKAAGDEAWKDARSEAEKAWKALTAAVKTFKAEYK